MPSTNTYNWAILGCGKIAKKFSSDLQLLDKAVLYACAARSFEKAQKFSKEQGFQKAYGSYEEMVKDPEIDIVYIATPHSHHKEHALLCLKHHKAVLCEKAFAINAKEVQQMIATAKKHNTFLMEAFWTRFNPTFQKVLEIIASKKLGELICVKSDFMFHPPFDPKSRLFDLSIGGGSLLDIGIYPVFTALITLGTPEKITCDVTYSPTGSDESLRMWFQYPDHKTAVLASSFACESLNESEFSFEKGSVRISRENERPLVLNKKGQLEEIFIDNGNGIGYQFEAAHVMECLDKELKESPDLPLSFSLELMQLLDRIRAKAKIVYPNHD